MTPQPASSLPADQLPAPVYETNQINVATFLMCRGHQPTGRGRVEGKKVFFQFTDKVACDALELAWLVGDDSVSARAYDNNFSILKRLIHGGQ